MLVVFGIVAVICALLMWGAERVDAPRRRAERTARAQTTVIQPAE